MKKIKTSKKDNLLILHKIKKKGFKEGIKQKEVFHHSSLKRSKEGGEQEGSEKMIKKIVHGMLKQKLNLSLIAKVTQLSEQEVIKISKSL